jgi:acetylornithine/LysW-gamma-L-lysine aminotransferase
VERALDEQVAAVLVEAVQGRAEVRVPASGYLATVAAMCGRVGALLIVDEEHTALRTGAPLACAAAGVVPDILSMGRGLANGLPFGVTVTRPEIARLVLAHSRQGGTATSPLVCAAAGATIGTAANPALQAHVGLIGGHLLTRLRALRLAEIREVRGQGLVLAIEMRHNAQAVVERLREHGVLVAPSRRERIRLFPPLILEKRQADLFVEAFAATLLALRRRVQRPGEEGVELRGAPAPGVRRDAR